MHPGKQPSETWDQVQIMSRMHFIPHLNSGSFISLTGLIPFGHITEIFVVWWPLRRDHQKWNSKKQDLLLPHDEKSHWSLRVRCGSMFPVSRCFFFSSDDRLNGILQCLAHSVHINWNNVCMLFTQTYSSAINTPSCVKPWSKVMRKQDDYRF